MLEYNIGKSLVEDDMTGLDGELTKKAEGKGGEAYDWFS